MIRAKVVVAVENGYFNTEYTLQIDKQRVNPVIVPLLKVGRDSVRRRRHCRLSFRLHGAIHQTQFKSVFFSSFFYP